MITEPGADAFLSHAGASPSHTLVRVQSCPDPRPVEDATSVSAPIGVSEEHAEGDHELVEIRNHPSALDIRCQVASGEPDSSADVQARFGVRSAV